MVGIYVTPNSQKFRPTRYKHYTVSLWSNVCYPAWSVCQFTSAASMIVQAYKLHLRIKMYDQPMVTLCGFVISVHKPFRGTSPDVYICQMQMLCMDLEFWRLSVLQCETYWLNKFLSYTRQWWVFAAQKWPRPLLSLPATTLCYSKVVRWLCCLDWAKPPRESITKDNTILQTIISQAEKFSVLCILSELIRRYVVHL